jgi:hypothetical protein
MWQLEYKMALQELWYGNEGPMLYDDAAQYPDTRDREASRAPQHCIDSEPTEYYHAVRLSGLTSKFTSAMSAVDSRITSAISASSDTTARSMATSAGTRASDAYNYADDAHTDAYTALSKLTSHGL